MTDIRVRLFYNPNHVETYSMCLSSYYVGTYGVYGRIQGGPHPRSQKNTYNMTFH